MKINVQVRLYAPSELMYFGGENKVVFRKKTEVELTPEQLNLIFDKRIEVESFFCRILSYDPVSNLMVVSGNMEGGSSESIASLQSNGWIFDRQAAKYHGLPMR